MPNIIIKEADLTSTSTASDVRDIVYIPGFSVNDPSDDTYVLGEPTFIDSTDEFETRFGSRPFSFLEDANVSAFSNLKEYQDFDVVLYKDKYYAWCPKDGKKYGFDEENNGSEAIAAWSDTTYGVGAFVVYSDKLYRCKEAVETASAVAPATDTEHWDEVLAMDSTTTHTVGKWYYIPSETAGAYVIYLRTIDSTYATIPDVDTENWEVNEYASTTIDTAYLYAKTLLNIGLPIYYEVVDNSVGQKCKTVFDFYARLSGDDNIFEKLADKGAYSIKYLTTGGYPIYKDNNTNLISAIVDCAYSRGDAVAYIDHIQGLSAAPSAEDNPFYTIRELTTGLETIDGTDSGSYATMFTPWCNYKLREYYVIGNKTNAPTQNEFVLPASFYYLTCLGESLKNNPAWLAVAGVTRGRNSLIDQKGEKPVVTNKMADAYQTEGGTNKADDAGRSVNGITNIRPYGLTIWGNRTLYKNLPDKTTPALAYLNIRLMVCDVKKTVYEAAQRWMFEPNDDILWINFQSSITPILDRMSTSGGLSAYKIIKQKSNHGSKLCATIILYPVYAVETVEVTIELRNEEITVE